MKILACFALVAVSLSATSLWADDAVVSSQFIYESAPFPACHASTIAETPQGMVAAWFGGTQEKHPDVGIWVARFRDGKWSTPVEVANGVQSATLRHPCWNPVLFTPRGGALQLYYKIGPSPSAWWGMVRESKDHGATWSEARRLPDGIFGPIKNKPVQLDDGTLLSPTSTEDHGWRVHFERSTDSGATWAATPPLNDGKAWAIIQPTIFCHRDGGLTAYCRSQQNVIAAVHSADAGKTWSAPEASPLPNNNSGLDGVTLADGRWLLVYNHIPDGTKRRYPLNIATSADEGKTWKPGPALETEKAEFSYPAVVQSSDGRVHITYTWKRQRIRHVVLDPAKF